VGPSFEDGGVGDGHLLPFLEPGREIFVGVVDLSFADGIENPTVIEAFDAAGTTTLMGSGFLSPCTVPPVASVVNTKTNRKFKWLIK